jgi:hypothetical protein
MMAKAFCFALIPLIWYIHVDSYNVPGEGGMARAKLLRMLKEKKESDDKAIDGQVRPLGMKPLL